MAPDSVPSRTEYVFDNAGVQTPERFRGLEALYDEQTQRQSKRVALLSDGRASRSAAAPVRSRVGCPSESARMAVF